MVTLKNKRRAQFWVIQAWPPSILGDHPLRSLKSEGLLKSGEYRTVSLKYEWLNSHLAFVLYVS